MVQRGGTDQRDFPSLTDFNAGHVLGFTESENNSALVVRVGIVRLAAGPSRFHLQAIVLLCNAMVIVQHGRYCIKQVGIALRSRYCVVQ